MRIPRGCTASVRRVTLCAGKGDAVMEELLLWRWSTLVQITSAWMLMVFFIVVRRSTGRRELDAWVGGWIANGADIFLSLAQAGLAWCI